MKIRETLLVGAIVAAAAAPAGAADLLERYEAAAETIGSKMYDYYVAKFPQLKGTRPEIAWNDAFRKAGQCMLDEYADKQGDAYAAKMVDRAEQAAAMSIDNSDDLQSMLALQMPDKISMADVKAVDQKCGMSRLGRQRAEQSGFLQKFSELSASGSPDQ